MMGRKGSYVFFMFTINTNCFVVLFHGARKYKYQSSGSGPIGTFIQLQIALIENGWVCLFRFRHKWMFGWMQRHHQATQLNLRRR